MVRGQYSQLMAPGLDKWFIHFRDQRQRKEEWPMVFNTRPSDSAFEDDAEFGTLGPQVLKPEGESVLYTQPPEGGSVRYINFTYALGVRMSFELVDDDKYGIIMKVPSAFARSGQFIREQVTWNVFNLGFTTIITTDGVSLFNNQHPLLGGTEATNIGPGLGSVISAAGTYPNRPATDIDLSFAGIQLMTNHFERLTDSAGLPALLKPKKLVIPPELRFIAREILGSPNKPYTADNEINALLAEELSFYISHYLTSVSAWFACADKEDTQIYHKTRKAMTQKAEDDFDTQSLKYLSLQRFSVGATSWYGLWGTLGP